MEQEPSPLGERLRDEWSVTQILTEESVKAILWLRSMVRVSCGIAMWHGKCFWDSELMLPARLALVGILRTHLRKCGVDRVSHGGTEELTFETGVLNAALLMLSQSGMR